ncbi:MAG: tetratricopeptide repeat protein [Planctomycetota bacterium]|jgi:tetratricopeptide (TPR) repeat protein
MDRGKRCRRAAGFLGLICLLGLFPLSLPDPVLGGDPEVAEILFKTGKTALARRQFEVAVSKFQKALSEDPALIQAAYWLGVAWEKKGEKGEALKAFRDYLMRFEEKRKGKEPSTEEIRFRALAEKRVEALAAGEREFQKLEETFIDALMKFARDHFLRDPAASLKALRLLLTLQPDHKPAERLFKKLGGKLEPPETGEVPLQPPPGTGPFADVKSWKDLIALKTFGKSGDWEYQEGRMVVDLKGGKIAWPTAFVGGGEAFAFEIEVRILEVYERGWLVGPVFGAKQGEFVSAFFQKTQVVLHEALKSGRSDLGQHTMPPIQRNAWHRIGVLVRGPRIEVWFDGKKVIEYKASTRQDFRGQIGFFHQRCKAEYRVLRLGEIK